MGTKRPSTDQIFNAAAELLDPAARADYLDDVCADDPELRLEIEDLLKRDSAEASFLKSPVSEYAVTTDSPPISERPGTAIGPYKLLQQIGEGGMGVVFMAEQSEPIQRTVALKIIKPGMDTRQVIARFEAERQAVAMMDHPNIARVIDAGTTDTGRPYFVMDLVKGVPITEYCDTQHLPVRARLELMADVCQAVQHAHQKGIIHRDLKPSNVLVAEYDGKPVPKIIDFGVAKATAQRLTERTMFTQYGQIVGTFEYMSPEQARFNQLDVDTRSDIYSLGVLLYELLAGSTPLEKERLRSAAFDEILRIISEEDPPRPSTRLSSSQALPSIAANRHTEPARLNKDVSGELDWIVMKCLEKDRNRRYETATGLGRDIERYLQDEPVQACPPSAAYRLKKFIRRNKLPVAAGGALTLALTLGVIGTTWQSIRATRASALARQEADKQQAINTFLREMLQSANPWARTAADTFKGRDATVVQVCDSAVARLNAGALKDRPEIEAALRATIGETYSSLERRTEGEVQLREAVRLGRLVYRAGSFELGQFTVSLAKNLSQQKVKLDEAEALMREGLRMRKTFQPESDLTEGMATLCGMLLQQWDSKKDTKYLAEAEQIAREIDRPWIVPRVLVRQGKSAEAEALYRQMLVEAPQGLANKPVQLSELFLEFAWVLKEQGKLAEAEPYVREALRLVPDSPRKKRDLAHLLLAQGKYSEAESLYREALTGLRTGPADLDLSIDIDRYAQCLQKLGRHAEAEAELREALAIRRKCEGGTTEGVLWVLSLLADSLRAQGKTIDVIAIRGEQTDLLRKYLATAATQTDSWADETLNKYAWVLATAADPAERDHALAVQAAQRLVQLEPKRGNYWNTLGVAQYRVGAWKPSIDALQKGMDLRKGGDAFDWFFLAMAHWQLDHKDEARTWHDKAIEWMDKNQPKNEELLRFRAEAAELLGISEPAKSTDVAPQP